MFFLFFVFFNFVDIAAVEQVAPNKALVPTKKVESIKLSRDLLRRRYHAMRTLPTGKVLFLGGSCNQTSDSACHPVLFDPKSLSIQEFVDSKPSLNGMSAIGMKINDSLVAFTNRVVGFDPNLANDSEGSHRDDALIFLDTLHEKWVGASEKESYGQASTAAALRYSKHTELIFFQGRYINFDCGEELYELLPGLCNRSVEIDVFGEIVNPGMTHKQNGDPWLTNLLGGRESYGTLRRARIQFDTTTFSDGRMFVVGGRELKVGFDSDYYSSPENSLVVAETAEFYLPEKKMWFETAPLLSPIISARSFAISKDEILVVDIDTGAGYIWSFVSKKWSEVFKLHKSISRAMVHSTGKLVALVEGGSLGRLFVWDFATKKEESLNSLLPYSAGSGLVELSDRRILVAQYNGVMFWDLKSKATTLLKD